MCNVTIAWFLGANTIFVIYVNHSEQLKIDQILSSRNVMKRHQVGGRSCLDVPWQQRDTVGLFWTVAKGIQFTITSNRDKQVIFTFLLHKWQKNRQLKRLAVSQINDKLTKSEFGGLKETFWPLWKRAVHLGNTAHPGWKTSSCPDERNLFCSL